MYETYLAIGFVSGTIIGSAFVGGGIILSTLLLFVPGAFWGHPMSLLDVSVIVGTQNVISALTASHSYRDVIQARVTIPLLLPGAIMSVVGALAMHALPPVAILALLDAVVVVSIVGALRPRTDAGKEQEARWKAWLAGAGVGLLSGLYGIGGGFLTVPVLMRWGLPVRAAVGNALIVGAVIAALAVLIKLPSLEFALFPVLPLVLVVAGSVVGAQVGSRVARRVPAIWIRRLVLSLLILVAVKIGSSVWTAIV